MGVQEDGTWERHIYNFLFLEDEKTCQILFLRSHFDFLSESDLKGKLRARREMAGLVFGHPFAAIIALFLVSAIAYKRFHWKKASKCEAFLSFSGEDALKNFADSLYKGMVDAGICVFRHDYWLHRDEKSGFQAIRSSKISIPILSPEYASNRRCLNELVQIMKCKNESSGHVVLPIFYGGKPTDVQFKIDGRGPKVVEEWERALREVNSLEWKKVFEGDGGQLVKLVVRKVLIELKKALEMVITENSVGIKGPVKKIMQYLDDGHASTLFIGIQGESGVGKTTLAKVIYNKLSDRFDYCSFIPNVRESCECNGIKYLRNRLISDISKERNQVYDKDQRISFTSSRFERKKILILLDDVNANHQLEDLVGDRNQFAPGSRIIVTTRDKSVHGWAKVDYVYEHKEMDENEAKILLARHAFRRDSIPSELSPIFDDVVCAIRRLPLILEVMGSYLCGKSRESWENTRENLQELQKLRKLQELQELQELLESQQSRQLQLLQRLQLLQEWQESQESQESQELQELQKWQELQQLQQLQEVQELLESQELRQLHRLQLLQSLHLLQEWQESQESQKLQGLQELQKWRELQKLQELQELQELLQLQELQELPQMEVQEILKIVYDALEYEQKKIFLDIACFLVGSDARFASYMWDANDSHMVLGIEELRFMSMIKIEDDNELRMHDELIDLGRSIVREGYGNELEKGSRFWEFEEVLQLPGGNAGTDNIQALSLNKGSLNGGQSYRYEHLQNLVGLRFLHVSDASFLGDFGKTFSKLRWFRWERCPQSRGAMNFSVKELAVLDLSGNMIRDDWGGWDSIKSAKKLKVLNLTGCSSLKNTVFLSEFIKLEILILRNCDKLVEIPPSIGNVKTLVSLDLSGCSRLKKLPDKLVELEGLKELLLDRTDIQTIPSFIGSLKKLEMLSTNECEYLTQTSDLISYSPLPDSIGFLVKLQCLSLQSCGQLRMIPDSICKLESLTELVLANTKIKKLPESIGNLQNLEILNISSTDIEKLPNTIGMLRKLWKLDASKCGRLIQVDSSIRYLCSLQHLNLIGCQELQVLPKLPSNLIVVGVTCKNAKLPSFSHLIHLEQLRLHDCESLEHMPKLPSTLLELEVLRCRALQLLTPLKGFKESLERLNIIHCESLKELDLSKLNHLRVLYARNCGKIQEIRGLDRLNDLKTLTIQGHPPIELDKPFAR